MRAIYALLCCILLVGPARAADNPPGPYAGSASCRQCHERFYRLWSTSMHGLAMQPYSAQFAKQNLAPQRRSVAIGQEKYRYDIQQGVVIETGRQGTKRFKIAHALGGKNVYYFLTPFDRGRLQTLPVAYDVHKQEWFDTAASGVRHFPGGQRGAPVDWREYPYTFNTACYNCHVSQLSTNYDLATDTYHTTWAEPGINCEACHGPASEHNRIALATPQGQPLTDPRIISAKTMTTAQRNDMCAGCHAKANPLTTAFPPGERFCDHFDLVTLEDPDYYPDGRDLGENYTFTSWSMSPCVKSGRLDCMHCHTSSGRYRFKQEKFNDACLPCHLDKVQDPPVHTRHAAGSEGSKCIACHMPMTSFARMNRSDHSMRPPAPAATLAYGSPNACNICHADKEAAWADGFVRQWRTRDYQAPLLERAALIDAARKRDWTRLPAMLAYIADPQHDEVFAASLIRLMPPSQDQKLLTTLLAAAQDPSPLVRGAAVQALGAIPVAESLQALIAAAADDYRLVRVRAAAGLAGFGPMSLPPTDQARIDQAEGEYLVYLTARPDQWSAHYNLGNYRLGRGENRQAVASYQAALKLDPNAILPMVNSAIAHARLGERDQAETWLRKALAQAPDNAAANFNMGLLTAEKKDLRAAEKYLKKAFAADPQMAQAAYNLCVITAADRLAEAVTWCRKASELNPQDTRYAYTLAFCLNRKGESAEAIRILTALKEKYPHYKEAEMLLNSITKQ